MTDSSWARWPAGVEAWHVEALGLRPADGAMLTAQSAKVAFRRQAMLHHPDTSPLPASAAAEKFRQTQEAYEAVRRIVV